MKENNIFTHSFGRGSLRKEKKKEKKIPSGQPGMEKQNYRIVAKWWTSFWAIFL